MAPLKRPLSSSYKSSKSGSEVTQVETLIAPPKEAANDVLPFKSKLDAERERKSAGPRKLDEMVLRVAKYMGVILAIVLCVKIFLYFYGDWLAYNIYDLKTGWYPQELRPPVPKRVHRKQE